MNASLTVYKQSLSGFIHSDFEIETLADDCLFTEGPVWSAKEEYYLFSDITANAIYKLKPGKKKEIFLKESGTNDLNDPDLKPGQQGSNGLALDKQEDLIVCRHGSHDIAKVKNGEAESFIYRFNERQFNSPNDLILHSDGTIYFSDPPYGLKEGKLHEDKFQSLAGVYKWRDGAVTLITDSYKYPNGVCLSPDERTLFVCSNKEFEKFISCYDTTTGEFLKVFAEETSDGIEVDEKGNIYLCNKEGIIILDAKGERLGLITLPTIPANCCWGGRERKDLFITGRERVYLIRDLLK